MPTLSANEAMDKVKAIEERLNQLDAESSSFNTRQIDTLIKNAQWCLKVLKDENIQIRDLKTLSRRFAASVRVVRDEINTFVGLAGLRANSTGREQYVSAGERMNSGDLIGALSCINGAGAQSVNDPDLTASMDSVMRALRRVETILPTFMLTELKEIAAQTGLVQIEHENGEIITKFNVSKKISPEEMNALEKQVASIMNENAINLLQDEVERISASIADGQNLFNENDRPGYFAKTANEHRFDTTLNTAPKR
ncbi:MAG: hypothetical protein PHT07_10025 [Paludibacter sp.]|nr:hypothetical protein [Paludibacter sp.]